MSSEHKWRVVKTNPFWWTVITPSGNSHGFNDWRTAMRVIDRAIRLGLR